MALTTVTRRWRQPRSRRDITCGEIQQGRASQRDAPGPVLPGLVCGGRSDPSGVRDDLIIQALGGRMHDVRVVGLASAAAVLGSTHSRCPRPQTEFPVRRPDQTNTNRLGSMVRSRRWDMVEGDT